MPRNGLKGYIPAIRYGWQLGLDELWSGGATTNQVLTWNGSVWAPANTQSQAAITALTGDVSASGNGSVAATVEGWWGMPLVQASFKTTGTLFTNGIPMYTGNSGVGWTVTVHKNATAVSGVVTMPGTNNGTNNIVTTDSLTTAAGADYTLQVIDGQFTSSTCFLPHVRYGTCTTGTPQIMSWTQTGGSATFKIRNTHPTAAFNGPLIVGMIGL